MEYQAVDIAAITLALTALAGQGITWLSSRGKNRADEAATLSATAIKMVNEFQEQVDGLKKDLETAQSQIRALREENQKLVSRIRELEQENARLRSMWQGPTIR